MTIPACSEQEFINLYRELQSTKKVAEALGVSVQKVCTRRRSIEKKHDIILPVADHRPAYNTAYIPEHQKARVSFKLQDGHIVVFSDAHYLPGEITTAHKGLLKILKGMECAAIVCNGDAFDGGRISRFPKINWDKKPMVQQEIETVSDRLAEIEKVAKNAKLFWPLGNHDARFETYLVARAPEFEGVRGFSLKDHFPRWIPCYSVMVNETCIIKHRFHNGIHAVYNNTLKGGISVVTGHLHSLKVTPWSDYRGDRYGVDTGTLADPYGGQFDYMEDNPRNWRAGFAVLTFRSGVLMPPELVQVIDENTLFFRGSCIRV